MTWDLLLRVPYSVEKSLTNTKDGTFPYNYHYDVLKTTRKCMCVGNYVYMLCFIYVYHTSSQEIDWQYIFWYF